jgi:rubrerythrin
MALYNVKQLLEMAAREEETGVAFYTGLAERAGNAKLRVLYSTLAAQEEEHAARLGEMAAVAGEQAIPPQQYPGRREAYVDALLGSRAFATPAEATAQAHILGDAESLRVALEMEKGTLLFYLEVRGALSGEHAGHLDAVVGEERGHVTKLSARLASH